jgi:hypothetical protein
MFRMIALDARAPARVSLFAAALLTLATGQMAAQPSGLHDPLLDRLIGEWVLAGMIDGVHVTHDVLIDRVLGQHYVRMHEVARERDSTGATAYEAIVFIGWDESSQRYACLWLDSTGGEGISGQAIGYGEASGDSIPFVFHFPDGSPFYNTFLYDRAADTWQWHLDGEEDGQRQPFARVTLSRTR